MRLIQIGRGVWSVCAVVDASGACDVLEMLLDLANGNLDEQALASKMRKLLEDWVPNHASGPNFMNDQISKALRDGVYEFKRGQKTGPKLRVLWFYGDGKVVVCTSCFLKRDKTDQGLIDNTIDIKNQYKLAVANGDIEIIEI